MVVEECKNKLVNKFIENPDYFWHETDMHCYLWNEFLKNQAFIYQDQVKGEISLVRREYPTNLFYNTSDEKIYFPVEPRKRGAKHGKLDIAIIKDPYEVNKYGFNRIVHGIELKFEADKTGERTVATMKKFFKNIYRDYRKLTDKGNEIENGHILYFTKEENTGFKKLDDIIDCLDMKKTNYADIIDVDLSLVKFSYTEINTNEEPVIIKNY